MCGYVKLGPNGREFFIDCILVEFPWHHPWPPIDFTRISFENTHGGPRPEPWKVELTNVVQILSLAGQFKDTHLADRMAKLAVEAGNSIAKEAGIELEVGWEAHAG
jgi:hypothetical protein